MLCCSTVTFQLSGKSHKWSSFDQAPIRPILLPAHQSLTHCIKSLEKLLLNRLLPLVDHGKLLPTHQFGFRPKHSTIEQTHRLIRGINNAIDNRQDCSTGFLDISQAFDKVWHKGYCAANFSHFRKAWQFVIPGETECLLGYIFITYLVGISYFWILLSGKHYFIPTAQLYKPELRMSDIFLIFVTAVLRNIDISGCLNYVT
jgi:hypothetical protein